MSQCGEDRGMHIGGREGKRMRIGANAVGLADHLAASNAAS